MQNKNYYSSFKEAIQKTREHLLNDSETVVTQDWQGLQTGFEFLELLMVDFICPFPESIEDAKEQCSPFWPWAEDHFLERVSGQPLNPPPSHKYWLKGNEEFKSGDVFSHSYPERFWPKKLMPNGYRYRTGDYDDLVNLLRDKPGTRQAYLPIYFPEDLGASSQDERVPCTLGYHIIIRDWKIHIFYPMRSCDALRHFHNDLYLVYRLAEDIKQRLGDDRYKLGNLHFSCTSFHCFKNDLYGLKMAIRDGK